MHQPSSVTAAPSSHAVGEAPQQTSQQQRPPSGGVPGTASAAASNRADLPPMTRHPSGRKSLATFGMPGRVLGLPADFSEGEDS